MKIRSSFISNSSSSSFVINRNDLKNWQVNAILDHITVGRAHGIHWSFPKNAWVITEDSSEIKGETDMDNFSMEDLLDCIGVPNDKIKWWHS